MKNASIFRLAAALAAFLFSQNFAQAQPAAWEPRGPGGGGAYYGPSINPAKETEFFVTTDMSGVYHSTDFGVTYALEPFTKIQGGSRGYYQFTSTTATRYFIDYADYSSRPMKTTNSGATWSVLPGNPSAGDDVYSLFADYANPNRLVQGDWSHVWFSTNGGTSFTNIHGMEDANQGVHIAGVFFDGDNIYIATNDGLLVSHNAGATFADEGFPGLPAGQALYSFCGAKVNGVTRFFGLAANFTDFWGGITGDAFYSQYLGTYRLDYAPGGTWQLKTAGIPAGYSFVKCCMAENDLNTVYISGRTNIDYPTVVKTTNGGTSWVENFKAQNNVNVYTGYCGQGGDLQWYWPGIFFDMTVAKFNKNKVLVTDYGFVHKTTNGGSKWYQAYGNPALQHTFNQPTPTGQPNRSIALENTSVWQVAWFDSLNLFGAYTDIKGCRSVDGGLAWNFNYTGHDQNTMYRLAKNVGSNTWYAATSSIHDLYETTRLQDNILNAGAGKVLFTTNKGATWQLLHDFGKIVCWVATDPANANRLYASVVHSTATIGGIYRSDNINLGASSTWTKLPNPPRTEGHPFNIQVLADGKVLATYSGRRNPSGAFTASSGVFLFDPANNTWADRTDSRMQYYTKDITVDPNDAAQNTWYAGVWSGWGGPPNDLGGLYKTTNRGVTWTRLNQHHRVNGCTFRPGFPSEIYYTTEVEGLWRCTNINAAAPTFTQVSGYTFRSPRRVFFNPYNAGEMWVGAFGNGIRVGSDAACGAVTNGVAFPVAGQPTKMNLYWRHVFTATAYQVRYRKTSPVGAWVTKTVSIENILLAGLTAGTGYEFQVRAKCGTGSYAAWSASFSFATPLLAGADERGEGFAQSQNGAENQLLIFPNPAHDRAEVDFSGKNLTRLLVFNALGQAVFEKEISGEESRVVLDLAGWPPGIFQIVGQTGGGQMCFGKLLRE